MTEDVKFCDWGDRPVAFQAPSGTPYRFTFHGPAASHTVVYGPAGGGMNMMAAFMATLTASTGVRPGVSLEAPAPDSGSSTT